VFFTCVRGRAVPVKLADGAGVDFGNRHVDGYRLFASLDLFLISAVAELALDFNVSALS
jgi:hypothetical protein